ncbi:MAG TPA: RNA polymerase sigma-70 factor [Solirubrobacter sp.]|nr:RNA polymerase sigma-70 factor [Solirubrobacter sp.]
MRDLLFSIAYRMLGSVAEAEDVVQEAYLRRESAGEVENERAFMTTVVTRLAIDVLRSARVRRESYVGEWLPEPLVEAEAPDAVETEEEVSLAMLVLLERLSPVERAVFVLRESFDFDFSQIAAIVDRSEDNCRQILSRARRRIEDGRPRFDADPRERRALADRFLAAARHGDLDGLVAMLAPNAVLVGDGGGIARSIARPMVGAAAVARALVGFYGQAEELGVTLEPVWVNGQPGFRTVAPDGRLVNVVGLDIRDGRVAAIRSVLNPHKLAHLGEISDLGLRPSFKRRQEAAGEPRTRPS